MTTGRSTSCGSVPAIWLMAACTWFAASTELVPNLKVTSMLLRPASLCDTRVSIAPTEAIACSIGTVIRSLTSSGVAPGSTVEICTTGMSKLGRSRTSIWLRP